MYIIFKLVNYELKKFLVLQIKENIWEWKRALIQDGEGRSEPRCREVESRRRQVSEGGDALHSQIYKKYS